MTKAGIRYQVQVCGHILVLSNQSSHVQQLLNLVLTLFNVSDPTVLHRQEPWTFGKTDTTALIWTVDRLPDNPTENMNMDMMVNMFKF